MTAPELVAAMHSWQAFYSLTGTAAATLTGLMFLAVTFGSGLVTKEDAATSRAFIDATFIHFVQAFVIACLISVPVMTATALGSIFVVMSLFRLIFVVRVFGTLRQVQRRRGDLETVDWAIYIGIPVVLHLLLLAAGVGFLLGRAEAFVAVAIFCVLLLLLGMLSTWELLIWMATQVLEAKKPGA